MKLVHVSDCWSVRLCSIVEVFDYRTFDCVRLAKRFVSWIKFDYLTQSSDWIRLGSITEHSIDYAGAIATFLHSCTGKCKSRLRTFRRYLFSGIFIYSSIKGTPLGQGLRVHLVIQHFYSLALADVYPGSVHFGASCSLVYSFIVL